MNKENNQDVIRIYEEDWEASDWSPYPSANGSNPATPVTISEGNTISVALCDSALYAISNGSTVNFYKYKAGNGGIPPLPALYL